MKLNNLMKQNKYIISVRGSAAGAGVSAAAVGATSSDGPVVATSASFS